MNIIYCYDAYCQWCFGFSKVMAKINKDFSRDFNFEVLSGGMILPKNPVHVSVLAQYGLETYKRVEAITGIKFGDDYLWHFRNSSESDWYPNSEKPAIALCIFKEYLPSKQVALASDLQVALQVDGRDLCDDEAYRHLLFNYNLPESEFYEKLHSKAYKEKAFEEFATVKTLKVSGYPCLMLQIEPAKFLLIANGCTEYNIIADKIKAVIHQLNLGKTPSVIDEGP